MIPKAQLLNVLRLEKFRPRLITPTLLWQPVLKTVQFHRKPRGWAVEVQEVISLRMLATELEASESSGLQRLPQLLFLFRLVTPEAPGEGGRVHADRLLGSPLGSQYRTSSPRPS